MFRSPALYLSLLSLLTFLPLPLHLLYAQQSEYEDLGITTVSGQRQGTAWIDQPYSVTDVSLADAEGRFARNLVDSLRQTEGVLVQKTANGHGSPFIRGFTGYRTLAMIDGVRYNNSVYRDGPNEYFSLIDMGALDRMELIHGPSSVVFGNDAIGGTLNLITKQTSYEQERGFYSHRTLSYQFSSAEGSHQERVSYELGNGGEWGLRLGLGARQYGNVHSAGIGNQPHTGYDERSLDLRFDKRINDQWQFTATHQQLEQDDVWRTHSTIFAKSSLATSMGSDMRRLKDQRRSLSYVQLDGELAASWADELKLNLSYQTWDENGERVRGSGRRSVDYFDSRMWGVDLQLKKDINDIALTYGVDFYEDNVDSGRTDFSEDGLTSSERVQGPVGDDARYRQFGIYAKSVWNINDRLDLDLGSRYARVSADVGKYEEPTTGSAASYSDSWDALVSSVRLSYALDEAQTTKLWMGISQSFRAPNIADISRYGGSRSNEIEIAATDLDPETFLTYELGLKSETEKYKASLSLYHTQINDYITSTPTGNVRDGLDEVSKQNSSTGYVQGIEIAGSYKVNSSLSIWGNATWIYGEIDISSQREPLSRLAPPILNAGLKWSEAKWSFGLDAQLALTADKLSSGDRSDTQRIPAGGTPSYFKIDAYAGYELNQNIQLRLGLSNLTNEAYRVHGSGNDEPGFGLNFGIKAHF